MIPLRDVIPSRTTPWVTLLLIAVNALAFGVMAVMPEEHGCETIARYGLLPGRWPWLAATTSLFIHTSALHLSGTLAALWLFGENVEDRFGHVRYLVFYLGLGYVTGFAEVWTTTGVAMPRVGASGAIAGILGAYLITFPRSRVLVLMPTGVPPDLPEVPATMFIAGWFLMLGAATLDPVWGGVTLLGLFTGAAIGAATAGLLRRPERQRVDWWAP